MDIGDAPKMVNTRTALTHSPFLWPGVPLAWLSLGRQLHILQWEPGFCSKLRGCEGEKHGFKEEADSTKNCNFVRDAYGSVEVELFCF